MNDEFDLTRYAQRPYAGTMADGTVLEPEQLQVMNTMLQQQEAMKKQQEELQKLGIKSPESAKPPPPDPELEALLTESGLTTDEERTLYKIMPKERAKAELAKRNRQIKDEEEREQQRRVHIAREREKEKEKLKQRWEQHLKKEVGYTEQQIKEWGTQQTLQKILESNLPPDEVYVNAAFLTDEKRKEKAQQELGRQLTDKQKDAVLAAHMHGSGEAGRDGKAAGVYNYTDAQIEEKKRILREADFDEGEIMLLMKKGIAGELPDDVKREEMELRSQAYELRERDKLERVWMAYEAANPNKRFNFYDRTEAIKDGLLPDEWEVEQKIEKNSENVYGKKIKHFYNLLDEIAKTEGVETWGEGGKNALWEVKDGNKIVINGGNFRRWVQQWMWKWHDDSPDDEHNFMQNIALLRPVNPIALGTMLYHEQQYFKVYDENGNAVILNDLVEQIKRDIYMFTITKKFDILYRKGGTQGSEKELASLLNNLHSDNPFTKPVWDKKSIFYWMFSQPAQYKTQFEKAQRLGKSIEELTDKEGEDQDTELGGATATAFLVYRNITNVSKLEELLGENSPMFSKDAIIKTRNRLAKSASLDPEQYATTKDIESIFKIHKDDDGKPPEKWKNTTRLKNGQLINRDSFIKLFNIYANPQTDVRTGAIVRSIVGDALVMAQHLYKEGPSLEAAIKKASEDSAGGEGAINVSGYMYLDEKSKLYTDVAGEFRAYLTQRYPALDKKGLDSRMKRLQDFQDFINGREDLKNASGNIRIVDELAKNFAEAQGYYNQRWTGGQALNDTKNTAFDAQSRILDTVGYRLKQMTGERGGMMGNYYNLFMFQRLMADFLTGTRTEYLEHMRYDKDGKDQWGHAHKKGDVIYEIDPKTGEFLKNKDGDLIPITKTDSQGGKLFKTPLQVIEEVSKASRILAVNPNDRDRITEITGALRTASDERHAFVRDIASQLFFPENTQQKYAADHMARAFTIFEILMSGKELDFSKFTKKEFSPTGALMNTFDKAAFGEAFQEKFMKPFRYGYSTWAQVDYTQKIPVWNDKKGDYEELYLAEAMFGKEILDQPEFWKKDYKRNKKGEIEKDKNGKPIVLKVHEHQIDVGELQTKEGKVRLFKHLVKGFVAAQLYSHRTYVSRQSVFSPEEYSKYFDSVMDTLKQIPSGVQNWTKDVPELMDVDLKNIFPEENFFTKEDINWIREHSATEDWRLFRNGFLWAVLKALFKGGKDALEKTTKYTLNMK